MAQNQDPQNTQFISEISKRINENVQRIRMVEENFNSIESRINTLEQNIMDLTEETNKKISNIDSDISEIRDKVVNISVDMQKTNRIINKAASKNDIKEIQEYVNLLTPMTSKFMTRKEVETMIKNNIEQVNYKI